MSQPPESRVIRDAGFGKRFTDTCDANANVPPPNFGRLGWLKDQLAKRFGVTVSVETVRKWLSGEVKPRPDRMALLAELLEVDHGWLALGVAPEMTQRAKRQITYEADGAILMVAGLIRLAGGTTAFPEDGDARADKDSIDLYAIIRGAQYAMHITVSQPDGDKLKFFTPSRYEGVMQIGVLLESEFSVKLIEIQEDHITQTGRRRGASIEVLLSPEQAKAFEIKSLRQRL